MQVRSEVGKGSTFSFSITTRPEGDGEEAHGRVLRLGVRKPAMILARGRSGKRLAGGDIASGQRPEAPRRTASRPARPASLEAFPLRSSPAALPQSARFSSPTRPPTDATKLHDLRDRGIAAQADVFQPHLDRLTDVFLHRDHIERIAADRIAHQPRNFRRLTNVVDRCDNWAGLSPIYRPSERLRAMAAAGEVFYPV